ncbi:hypothetical protein NDA10_000539 [Ustilago hordei]|nr:hypothetical protein NDA10_000539 [Ustilago hordei]
MRSPNFARAVLRTAARNSTTTTQHVLLRQLTPSLVFPSCTTSSSIPLVRLFSSTPISLKKKNRKNAFAAAEDEFLPEIEEAIEDDDLFGSVSSSSSPSTTSTTTPTSAMSKEEFARELESFSAALEWTSLDRGQFPSLHKWRYLAGHASSLSELDSILSLAKLYRDRVGALGLKSGSRFASRACAIGFPEVALNAFLNRYAVGLEYDQESLYLVQKRLAEKLNRSDREVLLRSAEIEGAPVQEGDLFRVLASEGVSEGEKDGGDGKAEAISTRHELDMPLARAQLSLIDRMSILATLSPHGPRFAVVYPHSVYHNLPLDRVQVGLESSPTRHLHQNRRTRLSTHLHSPNLYLGKQESGKAIKSKSSKVRPHPKDSPHLRRFQRPS